MPADGTNLLQVTLVGNALSCNEKLFSLIKNDRILMWQYTVYKMQYAICNRDIHYTIAIYNIQYAIHNIQYTIFFI